MWSLAGWFKARVLLFFTTNPPSRTRASSTIRHTCPVLAIDMGSSQSQGRALDPRLRNVAEEEESPKADEWPLHLAEHARANKKPATTSTMGLAIPDLGQMVRGSASASSSYAHGCYNCYSFQTAVPFERCVSEDPDYPFVTYVQGNVSDQWAAGGVECASSRADLMVVTECLQPLLLEIIGFLADDPADIAHVSSQVSRSIAVHSSFAVGIAWRDMFERRWPACAECLNYHGAHNWRALYEDVAMGRIEFHLEVFDREKKRGFAMSAMPARVYYEVKRQCYMVKYISASDVAPETIRPSEEHRLRFCPASVRCTLEPPSWRAVSSKALPAVLPVPPSGTAQLGVAATLLRSQAPDGKSPQYPHKVLEGIEGLTVGRAVELQWKMQFGSPFGWWYGHLDSITKHPDGLTATATISFAHFPRDSRWHRLEVRFGDDTVRSCSFGGYTGGLRQVSEAEHKRWMRFFPKEPVVF